MSWTPKFSFTVTWDNISGKPVTATRWPSWGEVTGKPGSYPPSSHTHPIDQVIGLQSTLDGKSDTVIPNLDPVAEIDADNFGTVIQPFRHNKANSIDPPSFFGTNLSPYLWLSGASSQQGVLIGAYASSTNGMREFAFRGRSGGGWSDWARVWHDGNFDPDSKAPVANPVFEGDLTVSTSLASGGVIVERRNQPHNSSIEYKTTGGSLWAGYGNNGTIGFSVGGSSNLTGSNTWFKAQDGAAFVYTGSTAQEIWHTGNFNPSDKADSSRLTWVGSSSGGLYADHLPENRGLSYMYHAAGNSPSDAPASPARQTAVLGMDTNWGQVQLAITNETVPQVFTRGSGGAAWTRIWTDAHNLDTTGNFTWTGNHTFIGDMIARSGSASQQLTIERTGNSINSAVAYTSTGGTIYAGMGDANYFSWGTNTDLRWSSSYTWGRIGSDGMRIKGTIYDSTGDVRKLRFITRNAATTLAASHLNGAVEKSNNSSYTYTIPAGLGSQGDAITFVNSGTSGNITVARATNVDLYRNGTNANITVGPGSMVTIYRSATTNRWIA